MYMINVKMTDQQLFALVGIPQIRRVKSHVTPIFVRELKGGGVYEKERDQQIFEVWAHVIKRVCLYQCSVDEFNNTRDTKTLICSTCTL